MSRFLIVVPPMVGHVQPTVAVGRELARRGHDVAWAGPEDIVAGALPGDLTLLPVPLSRSLSDAIGSRAPDRRGPAALKHLLAEFLLPLAHDMLPGVQDAVQRFMPDVLLVDQQALAGVAVAEALGLSWATSATTSATLSDPVELLPKVREWADGLQRDFLRSAGVDEQVAAALDLRFSRHLVLVFSTEVFVGGSGFPDHYVFVGPSVDVEGGAGTPFAWDWLRGDGGDAAPTVLVSLGTLNGHNGGRFFAVAIEALAGMDVRAVVVAPPDLVGSLGGAPNVLVAAQVPQLALMPHLSAVVCHGGNNTVCEALLHGVPLVVAPIRDDQPTIAQQVVRAGAGVRVKFRRVGVDELRQAVEAVLTDPALPAGAARVQASFSRAGGARAAADHLERLPAPARR